ncbi:MAG TPA: bacitracin ABC transporter ATP-binding protein [Chitinophagaceae bacterium]|nr:bacitracin ABC transporter ATP-binding protein [Chitinophagaceae bacterium]HCY89111.1 bacitracin ABC transporter ATP-binding protein [Chitinophagaceae bacterium]HRF26011.1 ABC transporter ATP-binding protein [Ferruginibacter sp.]
MQPIIEVNHLSKHYPGIQAVNDLSFTVLEGDVYGFLGQNGAGKSTTIRMLLTLIRPTSGTIRMFGMDVHTHRREVLSHTGAVIERPDLYKYLSAYDNLNLFAKMNGIRMSRQLLMERLDYVGLAARWDSKASTFSQGMKQRLGIAVALVHDPKLILLDEPTNGLDPQGIADMRNLITRLSRDMGKTVLVSSHLLHEIEQVATRMIIIDKGRKVTEGAVAELLSPAHTLVTIETNNNPVAGTLIREKTKASVLTVDADEIRVQMDKSDIPSLVSLLVGAGINIASVQPRHSLEDYFLSLTNSGKHVEPAAD